MSKKLVKGLQLSNSEDVFVFTDNTEEVNTLSELVESFRTQLESLQSKYNALKEEVDEIRYDQEHSGSTDSSNDNLVVHATTEGVNGGVNERP
jgi:hypothetical protein